VKLGKCLILVGFDDMGCDKGVGMGKLGFCLILLGILRIGKDGFLSWCVDESAIGLTAFPTRLVSFKYPRLGKKNG
jgi:hypothetical protein